MKPVGRAIEIVAIGLGQAGGNLAAEFYRRGHYALALNTAKSDLSSLAHSAAPLPEDCRFYIGLEGYDGAGADIAYGSECIRTHAARIRAKVAEHAEGADVVVVTAGLGGGTGSAVSELLRTIADLSLPTIVLATLPNEHESAIAKVNAVRAIHELVKENVLGWLFADNSRLAEQHGDVAFDRYYAEVNRVIVEPLDALNQLNGRTDISAIRSFDGEDYRTLLLSSSILGFATCELSDLSSEAILESVREGLLHSDFQPAGYQLENVSYLAIILEAPAHMLAETPFSFFEHLNEQLKHQSAGAAIYTGVYKSSGRESGATLRVFAASQTLPDGVQAMVDQARHEGGQLQAKLQRAPNGLELGDIDAYQLLRARSGARRRRIVTEDPQWDEPEALLELPAIPAAPPRSEPRVPSNGVPPNPPPAHSPGATLAEREAYERLVREFNEADADDVRKRVSDRLENDQKSANSLIRYYAVRTMSKLGAGVFADALREATQDEDATVRAVAVKALSR